MEIGAESAALTYGHPLGYIPAAALAYLIALLTHNDMPLEEAVHKMIYETSCEYGDDDFYDDFRVLIDKSWILAEAKNISEQDAIRELGEGWIAEEALAIAVLCSSIQQ